MNGSADRDERRKALEGQIDEMKRQQRDEQIERRIAIKNQLDEMKRLQKEEQEGSKKAIQEQIDDLKRLHNEQEARQKALMEQIDEMNRLEQEERIERKNTFHLGFVLKREKPCGNHTGRFPGKEPESLPDKGDVEVRKGFLKLNILGVLAEGPSHGYEIMHRISHHTGSLWTPSPGSMYPALEALETKGFISCQGDGRRKVYSLTPKGQNVLDEIKKKRDEQFLEIKAFMSALFGE